MNSGFSGVATLVSREIGRGSHASDLVARLKRDQPEIAEPPPYRGENIIRLNMLTSGAVELSHDYSHNRVWVRASRPRDETRAAAEHTALLLLQSRFIFGYRPI